MKYVPTLYHTHSFTHTLYTYTQATPSLTTSPRSAAHSPAPSQSCGTCEWQGSSQTLWITCIMTSTTSAWSYTEVGWLGSLVCICIVCVMCYVYVDNVVVICICVNILYPCNICICMHFYYLTILTYPYTYTHKPRSQTGQHRFHIDRNPKITRFWALYIRPPWPRR